MTLGTYAHVFDESDPVADPGHRGVEAFNSDLSDEPLRVWNVQPREAQPQVAMGCRLRSRLPQVIPRGVNNRGR